MKLSVFITEHLDEILLEWVAFARTLGPATHDLSVLALQDHAKPILEEIARDIETRQSAEQQEEKSQGVAPEDLRSAAAVHGMQRHVNDFSLVQLAAEFRALRATVLRLRLPNVTQMSGAVVQEMVRFNEAIDQALTESVVTTRPAATSRASCSSLFWAMTCVRRCRRCQWPAPCCCGPACRPTRCRRSPRACSAARSS